jgi:hypothetical protein
MQIKTSRNGCLPGAKYSSIKKEIEYISTSYPHAKFWVNRAQIMINNTKPQNITTSRATH